MLEAKNLTFTPNGKQLIGPLDLKLEAGTRTAILGENGAGKSLLLRLLHGLIEPSSGEVRHNGRPINRNSRERQAMVFQRPVMLRRSVKANLSFALGLRRFSRADQVERTAKALAHARLSHLADHPARLLSGGEQQRLSLVRALACDPEILFLDEPTASLDPASTEAIEGLITEAQQSGVTVLLVTHDKGQAQRMADEIIFLHEGRVAEQATTAELLSSPKAAATQAWLEGRLYFSQSTESQPKERATI